MKKNTLKNNSGLTLIEILVGVVVSAIMITAMYTTYSVVNNSYSKVTDRAKISRAGRDIVELLMRDIRMAGFKYILGTNDLGFTTRTYLEFVGGDTTVERSHDAIIIESGKTALGPGVDDGETYGRHDDRDQCCDRIHIVYDDFDQNDEVQPYKRYKVTYYAAAISDISESGKDPDEQKRVTDDKRYAVYKSLKSWVQPLGADGVPAETGAWDPNCGECYTGEKIRDYIVDMEFIPLDARGRRISPLPSPASVAGRASLNKIRAIDIKLTFRSKNFFYRFKPKEGSPRIVKALSDRTQKFTDRFLRDAVVVTVYTRNIGTY